MMKMNSGVLFFAFAAVAAGVVYYLYNRSGKKRINLLDIPKETIEGDITMEDIIGIFKSQNLEKGKEIPFVAQNTTEIFNFKIDSEGILQKDGYQTLFIGVFKEDIDSLSFSKIIFAKGFDDKLLDVLKKSVNGVVTLS